MRSESHEALAREVLIHGPIGRSALGKRLGLSPASLTRLAKPFVEQGLFVELDETSTGSVGRPVRPLDIGPGFGPFVGIKVTGDTAYAVLTDARTKVIAEREVALGAASPDAVVEVLAEIVADVAAGTRGAPAGVGVSVGGAVDDTGRVIRAPFLGWADVDLRAALAAATALPVTVENDVVALVEAERWFGVGRGREGFALITIGAGVGYGLVVGGQPVRTREAGVGLGGHIPLDPTGPLCPEGHRGCSSALITSTGMVAQVQAALGRTVTYDDVLALAAAGDPAASAVVDAAARGLGRMIALAANLTMQPTVVLAGDGIGLWDVAAAQIREAATSDRDPLAQPIEIVVEDATFSAWARGAAAVAIQAALVRVGGDA